MIAWFDRTLIGAYEVVNTKAPSPDYDSADSP